MTTFYIKYPSSGGAGVTIYGTLADLPASAPFGTVASVEDIGDGTSAVYIFDEDTSTWVKVGPADSVSTGDLTTSTTGVAIVGGTDAVVGAGTTVNISTASTSCTGLLTSVDWNTFNDKQPAGSYATTTLNNLGTTAVNASIVSDTDNTDDLGSSTVAWANTFTRNVKLDGSTSGMLTVTAPAIVTDYTLTLPPNDGSTNQYLQTNGSGTTVWADGVATNGFTFPTAGSAFGGGAAAPSITGVCNVVVGTCSTAAALTGGTRNIIIGANAMTAATDAACSIAIGYCALGGTTITAGNIFIGDCAGSGNSAKGADNVAVGRSAGSSATYTAVCNVLVGSAAGQVLTSGSYNVFLGNAAAAGATTAAQNVAIGVASFAGTNTSSGGVYIGYLTGGTSSVKGGQNTLVGAGAGNNGSFTGDLNSLFGYQAGSAVTTGSRNTFVGYCSGAAVTSGACNVIIGSNDGTSIATTNGNIILSDGAGVVKSTITDTTFQLNSGATAMELRLYEPSGSGTNYTAFKAQAQAGDITYTLPPDDGDSGEVLTTNGSGSLTWETVTPSATTTFSYPTAGSSVGGGDGLQNTSFTGLCNILIGCSTGAGITTQSGNTIIGALAGQGSSVASVIIGASAGMCSTGTGSVIIGNCAQFACFAGAGSTVVGGQATAGDNVACNTVIGYAGGSNTLAGVQNTIVGAQAGQTISTGTLNTVVGALAASSTGAKTGSSNVYVGACSAATVTAASCTVAVGFLALGGTTITAGGVYIGHLAGGGNSAKGAVNTVIGQCAGSSATFTGACNTFVGELSGASATSGTSNVHLGTRAGQSLTTGVSNVAVGRNSLGGTITSNDGVYVGNAAGGGNSAKGSGNVAIGACAGCAATFTGDCNVIIGKATGIAVTSGACNTIVGPVAAATLTTGAQNILLGHGAETTAAGSSNQFVAANVTEHYIGNPLLASPAATIGIQPSGGFGSDIAGSIFAVRGGASTGAATPGNVIIQTTTAAGSGSTLQTHTTRVTVSSAAVTITLPVSVTSSTESTSGSTGSIIASGGIGAAKNIVSGGQIVAQLNAIGSIGGGTQDINWNLSNIHTFTLTDNETLTFSNPIAGGVYVLEITQGGSGSYTITWPTVTWPGGVAPTLSTGVGDVDVITFLYTTAYRGNFNGDFV